MVIDLPRRWISEEPVEGRSNILRRREPVVEAAWVSDRLGHPRCNKELFVPERLDIVGPVATGAPRTARADGVHPGFGIFMYKKDVFVEAGPERAFHGS